MAGKSVAAAADHGRWALTEAITVITIPRVRRVFKG